MSQIAPTESIRLHVNEIRRLRRSSAEHEAAVERHLAALRVAIPPGSTCDLGDAVVHVSRPAWSCSIRRPDEVPLAFILPTPDKARILEHSRRTGEVLPGVSYSLAASVVEIRDQAPAPRECGPPRRVTDSPQAASGVRSSGRARPALEPP